MTGWSRRARIITSLTLLGKIKQNPFFQLQLLRNCYSVAIECEICRRNCRIIIVTNLVIILRNLCGFRAVTKGLFRIERIAPSRNRRGGDVVQIMKQQKVKNIVPPPSLEVSPLVHLLPIHRSILRPFFHYSSATRDSSSSGNGLVTNDNPDRQGPYHL